MLYQYDIYSIVSWTLYIYSDCICYIIFLVDWTPRNFIITMMATYSGSDAPYTSYRPIYYRAKCPPSPPPSDDDGQGLQHNGESFYHDTLHTIITPPRSAKSSLDLHTKPSHESQSDHGQSIPDRVMCFLADNQAES